MRDLGTLGGTFSQAIGINDRGQVIGNSTTSAGTFRGFIWYDGVLTDLGTLGGSRTTAAAINSHGQVVGTSRLATEESRAFLWEDGVMRDLGTLGGDHSLGAHINDRGQAVGASRPTSGTDLTSAFLWQNNEMLNLGTLGSQTRALMVNEAGQVIGSRVDALTRRAFFWSRGVLQDIGALPGHHFALVRALNKSGQVIGESSATSDSHPEAFVWENGVFRALGTFGGPRSIAFGINERGEIVGFAEDPERQSRAFIWLDGILTELPTPGHSSIARALNERGLVVGRAQHGDVPPHATLWRPIGSTATTTAGYR